MAMKLLCTICARGGSKGVPGKNVRLLASKPLLSYSIEQAQSSELFDCIAFSSDVESYREQAVVAGADLVVERPAELASDAAGKIPAIRHCVQQAESLLGVDFDIVVDLDCTSPLRSVADIVACVDLVIKGNAKNVITVTKARRSPYFNLVERFQDGRIGLAKSPLSPILRRQDAPECFDMNASIYVWTRAALFDRDGLFHADTEIYVMPEERSIDIDSELDFEIVSYLLEREIVKR